MILETIIIPRDRPNGFGFSVNDKDGHILVSHVSDDSAAANCGLRKGDIIYRLNKEVMQSSKQLVKKLGTSSDEVVLEVSRTDNGGQLLCDSSNIGTKSGQISNNISQNLSVSTTSMDINSTDSSSQILDSNYVPEEQIDNYLQPMTHADSFENNSNAVANVTRKQAYKKTINDIDFSDGPRISVKRATKSTSFVPKDPMFTIKKKTNTKMNDVATAVSQLNQRPRPSTLPVIMPNDQSSELQSNASSSNNIEIGSTLSVDNISVSEAAPMLLSSPSNPLQSSDPDKASLDILTNTAGVMYLEVDLKVISFKEKIKKPVWKKFSLEKSTLGVYFSSLDRNEAPMASNSTAIDPHIGGIQFYMQLWHTSNTISRFFLPIGQKEYDEDILMLDTVDSIIVKYTKNEVEFAINISRINEPKMISDIYSILQLALPEPKQPQIKAKRPHTNVEPPKTEPRKSRSQKIVSDSPRDSLLSNMQQTKLIENVPLVVVVCIAIVDKLGIRNEGIYRKSGNEGARRKLESVVSTESVDKWSEYEEWGNINTVCSLLKSILRARSLIDKDTAIKLSMINLANVDKTNQEQIYMDVVYHLRQHLCKTESRTDQTGGKDGALVTETLCRLETFKHLLRHLDRVQQCQEYNKMNADNLATCFSPTIIEDIPCDDEGEYQTSKKSEADKNLKQMVTFWIMNATFICDLLDEDEEQERFNKLISFVKDNPDQGGTGSQIDSLGAVPEENVDDSTVIREIIEHFSAQAFIPKSQSMSGINELNQSATDGNILARIQKSTPLYMINKQVKKEVTTRRGSATQIDTRKVSQTAVVLQSGNKTINPALPKLSVDNWATKSVRVRKKEAGLALRKEIKLTSMRLSGHRKNVPLVVDACITIVNKYGLNIDGIYRVSGKKQSINCLEESVTSNKYTDWVDEPYVGMWANMYTVSCFLKNILKQLCLIKKDTWVHMSSQFTEKMEPEDLRKVLMEAAYHLRHEKKTKTDIMTFDYLVKLEKEMTDDIRSATLRYVLQHLKVVSQHVANNRMTRNSLAVCFVPVLMEEDDTGDVITMNNKGIQILENLIDHCDWIFQWDDRPYTDMFGTLMRDSLDEYLSTYATKQNHQCSAAACDANVDSDDVRPLLVDLIDKSHSLAHSRTTMRRFSDSTDGCAPKSEYRQSKVFDDSQLPDRIVADDVSTDDSNDMFQRTVSIV